MSVHASLILSACCVAVLSESLFAAKVDVVLTTVTNSPVSSIPNAADGPVSGSFTNTTTPFGTVGLSSDGSQFVIGAFTNRTAAPSTVGGASNLIDNAYIRGSGTSAVATVTRSGVSAGYTGIADAVELDLTATAGTISSLYAGITNDGSVLYVGNTSEPLTTGSTTGRRYNVYVTAGGAKSFVSRGNDLVSPQPIAGQTAINFSNNPGVIRSLDGGFLYFNSLNRSTSNAGDAGIFRYNQGDAAYSTAATTNTLQVRLTDRYFGVSADGANTLSSGQFGTSSGQNNVVVNGVEVARTGGSFVGGTLTSSSDNLRALMGSDGTYAVAGQLVGSSTQNPVSFLAIGTPGGTPTIVAQSGDVIDGPVANERIPFGRLVTSTIRNASSRLNTNFAVAPDGSYAYVAETSIAAEGTDPNITFVPGRSVLMHGDAGYLLGLGDAVLVPTITDGVMADQTWFVSNFSLTSLALSNELAYVSVTLRGGATYNTAPGSSASYATFSGDTSYAVLAIAVPEPTMLSLAACAAIPLLGRRRRR